jgi:hypothetical protein
VLASSDVCSLTVARLNEDTACDVHSNPEFSHHQVALLRLFCAAVPM